ncbi:phosphotransferase family protein [Nocardia alni]|uniref:phosphotransferase family protein n=1 Tax=Nocardia alni TaxID=2815723 RepID=UPI001C24DA44|nr:phosphotransferase family protein [Nocardia alni]
MLAEADTVDATATVSAVHRALDLELEGAQADRAQVSHVLGVADALFHRAVLADLLPDRRDGARDELQEALSSIAPSEPDPRKDPYRTVAENAGALVAGDLVPPEVVERVLRAVARTDLPELGVSAPAERLASEAVVMNWLGKQAPATLSIAQVEDHLSARSGQRVRAQSVAQLSGGFSKTTIAVCLRRPDSDPEEIVLRQVTPGREAHTLVGEYDVLRFVWERGIDVAEPLWIEPRDNPLGGPYFASRRVSGGNLGDVFGPDEGTDPKAGLELARALAKLHAVALDGLPGTPVPPMSTRAEVLAAIDEQEESVAAADPAAGRLARPLHTLLFAWLRAHAPTEIDRPVLLHGDPGFHNILVNDGSLSALLDWERARVGDAAQDLAYVRPHVTRVQPWEEFLQAYQDAGGEPPDEDRLHFYEVWHDAWRFAGGYRGLGRLVSQPRTLLDGVLGLLHAPRFLLSGLQVAFEVTL